MTPSLWGTVAGGTHLGGPRRWPSYHHQSTTRSNMRATYRYRTHQHHLDQPRWQVTIWTVVPVNGDGAPTVTEEHSSVRGDYDSPVGALAEARRPMSDRQHCIIQRGHWAAADGPDGALDATWVAAPEAPAYVDHTGAVLTGTADIPVGPRP